MATVHLIDASPYIFRAYFALPESMLSPTGEPVNAVYGFASFLIRYIKDQQPTHLGIAFDESLTTSFRNELYPEYKAQRELPPSELEAQLKGCQEIARSFGAATYAQPRFEADDIIGTLTAELLRRRHEVVVTSSDKDLSQLVGEHVQLFDYARGLRYGPDEVFTKLGVWPEQVADFLGLAGDSVDNIPGVRGVGPKTAAALLEAFGDLDRIYDNLDRLETLAIRGAASIAKKLAGEREVALLSRELATIATDAPIRTDLRELRLRGADRKSVTALFERLGFGGLSERVPYASGRAGR